MLPYIQQLLLSFFVFLALVPTLSAQTHLDGETPNTRIDPLWTKMFKTEGFSWAHDIKTDAAGNSYLAGYFQRGLEWEGKTIRPNCKSGHCPDTYFLMKLSPTGQPLWLSMAQGNARPQRIAIDKDGAIYTVGSVYSEQLQFVSTANKDSVWLDKPKNYKSGLFICKYNTEGKLLKTKFYGEVRSAKPNDLVVDDKGQLYIGGQYEFRYSYQPSMVRNSLLLLKFDTNWDLAWKIQGDTLGTSTIQSLCKSNGSTLYVTGNYEGTLRIGSLLHTSKKSNQFILAQVSTNGKIQWLTDSLKNARGMYGENMVADSEGNAYVAASTPYGSAYLAKVNKKGAVVWLQTIQAKGRNHSSRMLIDASDRIYLCGEGYGAVFPSTGPQLLSYKSKGGTDFYIASYSDKGQLLWLKAGGGAGTDYCKSIALYRNHLLGFGWFDNEMAFKDTVLKGKKGQVFWLGQFALEQLAAPPGKPQQVQAILENRKASYNTLTCECPPVKPSPSKFVPSLSTLLPYEAFQKAIPWKYANAKDYAALFFSQLQNTGTADVAFYSLTALSSRPIRLVHPKNAFTVNLSPCQKDNETEVPLSIVYTHSIKKYDRGFEHESFDRSAKSYLEVLMEMAGIDEDDLLEQCLFHSSVLDLPAFIKKINKRYGTTIVLAEDDEEATLQHIQQGLAQKKIALLDFILQEFVFSNGATKTHPITKDEGAKLEEAFGAYLGHFTIQDLDRIIYPRIVATIEIPHLGIELNNKLLHRWDALRKQPLVDKKGIPLAPTILAELDPKSPLQFESDKGIRQPLHRVCFTRSEIAGTGILLHFSKARLVDGSGWEELNVTNYPHLITDTVYKKVEGMQIPVYTYDTLLTKFAGLVLEDAQLFIPFQQQVLTATSSNLLVNNRLLTGSLLLPLSKTSLGTNTTNKLWLKTDGEAIETSLPALEKHFRSLGLNSLRLVLYDTEVVVHFIKTAL